MLKRIIVSQRVDIIESYGERRDALDQNWYAFCRDVGVSLLIAPNDTGMLDDLLSGISIDGVLLTGGNNPVDYGGNVPERDNTDSTLIKFACENNLPLIGVCRGCQSIALYFGGKLEAVDNHIAVRHKTKGFITREVNSFHGYAVSRSSFPVDLEIISVSEENVAEALRHKSKPVIGIMWHPEREKIFNPLDIELFRKHYGVQL